MPLPGYVATRPAGRHRRPRRPATAPQGNTAPALLSRRSMLRGAAGAGAAGLAMTALASPALAVAATSGAGANAARSAGGHVPDHIANGEPVVVHVRDVRSGEMDVYRGTTHARVQDRALAARLATVASAGR